MKLKCERYAVEIIPENTTEEIYLETVLGLTSSGMEATATRKSPIGMEHVFAYVEIKKA